MNIEATLTPRESQVSELLAWGATKKEVAYKLDISEHTVDSIAQNVYRKAEVRSIGQLSAWYFCKRFNISKALNPLLAMMMIALLGLKEVNRMKSEVRPVRTRIARTTKRTGRRDDYEPNNIYLL